ncbi:MAG: hypothetical protein CMP22_07055 [Rickettsiales bacterium]|nr:hypothetical protein [Rickettsiales bacterium]
MDPTVDHRALILPTGNYNDVYLNELAETGCHIHLADVLGGPSSDAMKPNTPRKTVDTINGMSTDQ